MLLWWGLNDLDGIFQGSIEDKIDESLSKERMSSKALRPLAHEVTD